MSANNTTIDVDKIHAELDAVNVAILDLLERGKGIVGEAAATITDAAMAAGDLVTFRPATIPTFVPDQPLTQGEAAHWEAITTQEYSDLQDRIALLGKLVDLLEKPIGNASFSYSQKIRARASRWRAARL